MKNVICIELKHETKSCNNNNNNTFLNKCEEKFIKKKEMSLRFDVFLPLLQSHGYPSLHSRVFGAYGFAASEFHF